MNNGNWLVGVSFSPDGRFVAEICDCRNADGMAECIFLCDRKDGKVLQHFPAEGSFRAVWEAVFSPDSKVVAANIEGTIYRWSTETGEQFDPCVGAIPAHAVIRFSADGKTLIAVSDGHRVSHWDVAKRAMSRVVELKAKEEYWHQALSHDGRLLAVAAGVKEPPAAFRAAHTSTLQLFDTTTGKECCTFQGDTSGIQTLVLSQDSRRLIGIAPEGDERRSTISVWDTQSGALRHRFSLRLPTNLNVGVTPDGRKLFTSISSNHGWLAHGAGEAVVRWWDTATGKELMTKPAHEDRVEAVCFTPDGRFLLSAANDASVRIWDIASGRSLHCLSDSGHCASCLSVVSAQGTFLSGGGDDRLHLCDWRTGQRLQSFAPWPDIAVSNSIQAFVVSPDGREATSLRACFRGVASDGEYFFDIWDLATDKIRNDFLGPLRGSVSLPRRVRFSHFHRDGKRFTGFLFAGDPNAGEVVVGDIVTGRIELTLNHADRRGMRAATAADGRTLVTATTHGWQGDYGGHAVGPTTIHVWELSSGRQCRTITVKESGPDDHCDRIALAPDCRTLITVSHNGTLRFWDILTGEEVLERTGVPARVTSLAFSPDSKLLATGHADSTILLWDVSSIGTRYQSRHTNADAQQMAAWWEDLASSDPRKAHPAVGQLSAAGAATIALLRIKVVPAPEGQRRVASLIADLDQESFDRREKASRELAALLPQVRPALMDALARAPSPEAGRRIESLLASPPSVVRDVQLLRDIRGIQVLEQIAATGADAARLDALDFLKKLAAGAAPARLTQEAKAAVDRLVKRVTAKP